MRDTMLKRLVQLLLGASWFITMYFIFIFIAIMTEARLAPWDMISEQFRPDSSTWQYALNRFFETGPGLYTIVMPLTIASAVWVWKIVKRRWQKLLELVIGNILFAVMLFVVPMVANPINNMLFGDPREAYQQSRNYEELVATIGYHTSIIPLLLFAIISGIWLYWQFNMLKVVQQSKQKRKREATQPDTNRLALNDDAHVDHRYHSEHASLTGELT